MAKLLLGLCVALLAAFIWASVPHYVRRTCPVCEGAGYYTIGGPVKISQGGKVLEKERFLCPFCDGGTLSLYDLRQRQTQMLKWMVKQQKLPPEELVRRVNDSFGQEGLDELHANNFFMDQGGEHGSAN
jgi:hypothetical protein